MRRLETPKGSVEEKLDVNSFRYLGRMIGKDAPRKWRPQGVSGTSNLWHAEAYGEAAARQNSGGSTDKAGNV